MILNNIDEFVHYEMNSVHENIDFMIYVYNNNNINNKLILIMFVVFYIILEIL